MIDPRVLVTERVGLLGDAKCVPIEPPAGLPCVPCGVNEDDVLEERLVVNMGPQHPSTHGVLRLLVELDGEQITAAEAIIGYLHRGIEKLAESRRYDAVGTLMDRGDYVSGIHNELAFALATERLLAVEAPPKADWIRALVGELNRIASHLIWYGPMGLDAGAMGQFLYAVRDREAILDILEEISGSRMMFNYVRPGGVLRDLPAGIEAKVNAFLDDFDVHLPEHEDLLGGNEIFQMRTRGVGVMTREQAIGLGMTGANLRATGVGFDIRRDRPYAAYGELAFDVPIAMEGDCYARYAVRMEEMRQSARMVRQCLAGMPDGDFRTKVPKIIRPPEGEAYAAVESPRGELGCHVISDGTEHPYRMRYRPPAFYALQAIEMLLPGGLVADGVVIGGSFDIVLGEVDR
jgi:NADH-quinone oxidoreductase subunit D